MGKTRRTRCGAASDGDGQTALFEPFAFGKAGCDVVASVLQVGKVADIAHPMVDDIQHQLGLQETKYTAVFGMARPADELSGGYILEELDFAAGGFVAVYRTDVEVVRTVAVKADDFVAGGDAVFVGAAVGLAIGIFQVCVAAVSEQEAVDVPKDERFIYLTRRRRKDKDDAQTSLLET